MIDTTKTRVANIRDLPTGWQQDPRYVYIGRANRSRGLRGSPLANPFKIGEDGDRAEVVALYRLMLNVRPDLQALIPALAGKLLVCWCAPLPCHGDVLADLANQSRGG